MTWEKAKRSKYQHFYRSGRALCGSQATPVVLWWQRGEGARCPKCQKRINRENNHNHQHQ